MCDDLLEGAGHLIVVSILHPPPQPILRPDPLNSVAVFPFSITYFGSDA